MRARAWLAVALVFVLAAVGLQRWAAVETAPALATDARPAWAAEAARWSAAPAADAGRRAQAGTAPAAPPAASAPVWDLCGIGRLPVPAGARPPADPPNPNDLPDLPDHLGKAAVDAGRVQLLAALRQGGPRARAAAAYWAPLDVHEALSSPASDAAAEQLLALAGDDPAALRWAAARCRVAACREAVAARWIGAEPGNVMPRLMRLSAQGPGKADTAQLLEGASAYRAHWGAFADTARQAMPAGLPGYVQMSLLVEALGIEAAMPDDTLMFASSMCKPPFDTSPERRARCDALGRLMSEHGDTLLGFGIGVRLREWAGLAPAEARALREPVQRLSQPWSDIVRIDERQPLSCESLAGMQQWVKALGSDGELAAMRAAKGRR